MSGYVDGETTVGTTATVICTVQSANDGVMVQNSGAVTVYFGGPAVVAGSAVSLAANSGPITLPTVGGASHELYGITASSTTTVSFLYVGQ